MPTHSVHRSAAFARPAVRRRGPGALAVALAVAIAAVMLSAAPALAEPAEALPFRAFRDAIHAAGEQRQVTIVYFTADWCTWCQRMERVSFRDERALRRAEAFQWAKVDTERQPYLAGAFGIRSVPAMAFLNAHGELLELRHGYINPDALNALLDTHADQAEAPGRLRRDLTAVLDTAQRMTDADDEQVDGVVLEALTMLAEREVVGHELAQRSVLELGQRAWPALVSALRDDRLAVRAAAHALLVDATGAELTFDPFASEDERLAMAAQWRSWLGEQVAGDVAAVAADAPSGERERETTE